MLDLKGLDTFVWVARLGGFRAAAERLNTTQPAISARIAQLESELGVKLFDRNNRRAALTPKGVEALDYAERILALKTELFKRVSDRTAMKGILRLGVAETIVHTWLSRLVEQLHRLHPGIALEIEVDVSPNLRDRLAAHDLDIAFLLGAVDQPRLRAIPLCRYAMAWVANPALDLPSEPLSLTALAQWPLITFGRQTAPHMAIREIFAGKGLGAPRIYGNSSLWTVLRMAQDGIGIAAIPLVIIGRELAEGRLRRVEVEPTAQLPELEFSASYAVNSDSYLAAVVAELAAQVAENFDRETHHESLSQSIEIDNLK